jgi:hypothetical protein
MNRSLNLNLIADAALICLGVTVCLALAVVSMGGFSASSDSNASSASLPMALAAIGLVGLLALRLRFTRAR